ncbi:AraC family transcriptional regulator, partial [uncultured Traorella sp.]|uniref:helix-turn-helix domain-containing protein n=1 Tax=uncultured Traorella sp. TaxID=1929048 RepID=UPI0025CF0E91
EILENLRLKDVSRLQVKEYKTGTKKNIRNRIHYGLIFCERGNICFRMHGRTGEYDCVCTNNEVILAPKNSDYDIFVIEDSRTFIIDFELFAGHFDDMHEFIIGEGVTEYYCNVFLRMQKNYFGSEKNDLVNLSFLYDIIAHVNDRGYNKKRFIVIEKSEKYLEKNLFSDKLSVKNIAQESNISEVYFRKMFKEKYGKSPLSYINDMRIKKAKELIINEENLSIKEVSDACGFLDIYSFSRSFKKNVGVSPSQYRKKMQFRNC